MSWLDWIDYTVFDNSLLVWASGFGLFLLVWAVLVIGKRLASGRLSRTMSQSKLVALSTAAHVVDATRHWFLLLAALYVGSTIWALPTDVEARATTALVIVVLLQAGLWATAALMHLLDVRRKHEMQDNPSAVATMDLLSFAVRVGVWSVALLVILDNLGINVTALVAGLGVGGIAVALAAQNILGDLFASLSIILDKPFAVGDFLIIGDYLGSVERVGIKTTRMRSLSGEQIVFSNNDLLSSRIRNYGRMFERRVVFSVGVTYQTPAAKLASISKLLKEAVTAEDGVRFDRAHFKQYGDFALIYEVVYYVLSPDYNRYMDIQQAINISIFESFAAEDIEFAYPTQTIFLQGNADGTATASAS
jgi:small-conductance mechanosensitive channel